MYDENQAIDNGIILPCMTDALKHLVLGYSKHSMFGPKNWIMSSAMVNVTIYFWYIYIYIYIYTKNFSLSS